MVVTSKDANLTKAHGRYLESRLIALAVQAGRSSSTTAPIRRFRALPEAHASDMDYFIDQLQSSCLYSASTPSAAARRSRSQRPVRTRSSPRCSTS